ncbi:sugar phosphate isomerase/epimerase family protein [Alkalihalophilus lindianensis]|uniref:Sugar phosphate isomerase/epimerase family protein n=1 Tax=Alkalihalophilus lindianensis TaxID=1630542 RepID=A0ABU3XG12_9BACI|nr:sugar phosphate isomerase/epimerase family protein [Alkalihalophilus lindianensis]MDV2686552.1 sugar phosphate isomerase/epimerase family protein [Alkalihalophilus lindianensis]
MNLSLCTITFRHHLQSLEQIAQWARLKGFDGIELWGVHARKTPLENLNLLKSMNLNISMLSDYLPLGLNREETKSMVDQCSSLLTELNTNKLRTFAGAKASRDLSEDERKHIVDQLRLICERLENKGQLLLIETHPNTLADNLESTLRLIEEVNHPSFKINYDALHIWESGADPILGFKLLEPYIAHVHLKNIRSREDLNVFAPNNVYSPAGSREGMVSLFEGSIDYHSFFAGLMKELEKVELSLEWFGEDVYEVLFQDLNEIRIINQSLKVHL